MTHECERPIRLEGWGTRCGAPIPRDSCPVGAPDCPFHVPSRGGGPHTPPTGDARPGLASPSDPGRAPAAPTSSPTGRRVGVAWFAWLTTVVAVVLCFAAFYTRAWPVTIAAVIMLMATLGAHGLLDPNREDW